MIKSELSEHMTLPNDVLLPEVARLLSEGHTVTLQAKGRSMFPFITGGRDSVILRKTTYLQTGDIVLAYVKDRGYILHRIFKISKQEVILMGDGNVNITEQCKREDIAGKVLEIIRNTHHIDCSSRNELCKIWIWRVLLPVRRYILGIYYRLNRLYGK